MNPDTIQRNFEQFDADNPHVYTLFERYARRMIDKLGAASAGMIFERIRWDLNIATVSDKPVKLNNNYRSRYVRKFEARNPGLRGKFRTRRLSAQTLDSTSTVPPEEHYKGARV